MVEAILCWKLNAYFWYGMLDFKKRLWDYCKFVLQRKIELISYSIDEIIGSMENETKSSLGDKHETSRARMQAEQDKLSWQMNEMLAQLKLLKKVNLNKISETISNESLVITDKGIFFITIPLGKIEFETKTIFVISDKSPVGSKLIGLRVDEELLTNNVNYKILEIL